MNNPPDSKVNPEPKAPPCSKTRVKPKRHRNQSGPIEFPYDLVDALSAYPLAAHDLLGNFADQPPVEWTASLQDQMAIEFVIAMVAAAKESHRKVDDFLDLLADHLKAKSEVSTHGDV